MSIKNYVVVLTTVISVDFTDIVKNINYVCDWYQNNDKLIILTTLTTPAPTPDAGY